MAYQIKDENGGWIGGTPTQSGQHYRFFDDAGGVVESYWSVAQAESVKITKLAFRNRFTFAEKVAVETAAESDPVVRVLLKDQEAATFIDLSRQDTIDGVQLLVSKSLLTQVRADEILSLTIANSEQYGG